MASTQSLYVWRCATSPRPARRRRYLLPYLPNSMVISNDGSTLYLREFHRSDGAQYHQLGYLVTRSDTTSPGSVLADVAGRQPDRSQRSSQRDYHHREFFRRRDYHLRRCRYPHAEYTPDSQTVYIAAGNQILVYSERHRLDQHQPCHQRRHRLSPTWPSPCRAVGAYFAGPNTTARSYCAIRHRIHSRRCHHRDQHPSFRQLTCPTAITDRLAATNDGLHIVGATVTPAPTLEDLISSVPYTRSALSTFPSAVRI
jgi:hypothetical protein